MTNQKNPIRKYAEIRKYDKAKSKWIFSLLKFGELFAAFLFTFGIYGLGIFTNTLVGTKFGDFYGLINKTGVIKIWTSGLNFFFMLLVTLLIIIVMGYAIYLLIKGFLVGNWKWSQRLTETPEGKEERKKENEKLKKEYYDARRKIKGFLKGDMVKVKSKLKINKTYGACRFVEGMKKLEGKTAKIVYRSYAYVDNKKHYYYRIKGDENHYYFDKDMLELKQERDLKSLN